MRFGIGLAVDPVDSEKDKGGCHHIGAPYGTNNFRHLAGRHALRATD
jgi:hypothetical protein